MDKNKICFLLNYGPHYRKAIFKKINDEIGADFYFGDIPNSTIKKIDYDDLSNFKKEFKTVNIKSFFWFKDSYKIVFKYNIIVLTGDPQILSNWLILILARLLGKKTYLWTHGWYGNEKKLKKIIKRVYFLIANKILLYGDYAKQLMIDIGFDEKRLIPVYNSLNYEDQLVIRNNLKKTSIFTEYFKNNNPVIIYIGRIQKVKRLDLFFKAFQILNNENNFMNLVIVGKDSENVNLEDDIIKNNLEKQVWLYGSNYIEKKNGELIYNADLCISPGNIGLTAIHSLMYGTPVIAHSNFSKQGPEFETIVENYSGAYFNENDVDDLVVKIKQVLGQKLKPSNCYDIIDNKWNPNNQIKILQNALNAAVY